MQPSHRRPRTHARQPLATVEPAQPATDPRGPGSPRSLGLGLPPYREKVEMDQCQGCGAPITQPVGRGRPRKWCSAQCATASRAAPIRPRPTDLTCMVCAKAMYSTRTSLPQGQATCRACRRAASTGRARYVPQLRPCRGCTRMFETRRSNQIYCGPACSPWTAKRGTTPRGYGSDHQALRKRWLEVVKRGGVPCAICFDEIEQGDAWHLDHTEDRSGYRGPAHADCNLSDGARRGNRVRRSLENASTTTPSRTFSSLPGSSLGV